MFKNFIENYSPKEVITYADRRWSNGEMYKHLGFNFEENTKPSYFYVANKKRENRFKYRKSELIKQGFNKNISEKFARFRFFLIFALRSGERKPGQPTSHAQVVELVDTLVSGTSASDSVQVRVLSWAPTTGPLNSSGPVYFFLMRKRPCAVAAALQPVVAPNTNPSTCMQPIGRTPPAHLPSVASVFSPTGRQRENAFLRCSIPIRHRAIHQLLTCSER